MPSKEVNDAIGAEGAPGVKELAERAAALRQIVDAPTQKERAEAELREVEAQLAETRERKGKGLARARQVGIRRAHGSKRDARERLLQERLQLAKAFAENTAQLRAVDADLALYEREDAALADRFDLTRSDLPRLTVSGGTPEALEAYRIVDRASLPEHHWPVSPKTELAAHGMHERRSYAEVADSEGYKIIMSVGLKAWPALTEREQTIIAERARDHEEIRRQLAELPNVANVPSDMPLAGL